METIESKQINDWLNLQGKNPALKNLFQLVWSTDQHELRTGTYCTYLGDILMREETKTEWVPKYPDLLHRWILEQWYPPELVCNSELPNSHHGSYEPIYVFENKKGKILPLNIVVVQFIVHRLTTKSKPSGQLIRSVIEAEIQAKEDSIYQLDMDYLDTSDTQSLLHFGEGIIVPSNYEVQAVNLRQFDKEKQ